MKGTSDTGGNPKHRTRARGDRKKKGGGWMQWHRWLKCKNTGVKDGGEKPRKKH